MAGFPKVGKVQTYVNQRVQFWNQSYGGHSCLAYSLRFFHFTRKIVYDGFFISCFVNILYVISSRYVRVVCLLSSFIVCASFVKTSCGFGDGVAGKGHNYPQNFGHNDIVVLKFRVPLEYLDEFLVDELLFIEIAPSATQKQGLVKLETNFLQLIDVEELLNVYGRFSINMNGGNLHRKDAHLLVCTFRRHG